MSLDLLMTSCLNDWQREVREKLPWPQGWIFNKKLGRKIFVLIKKFLKKLAFGDFFQFLLLKTPIFQSIILFNDEYSLLACPQNTRRHMMYLSTSVKKTKLVVRKGLPEIWSFISITFCIWISITVIMKIYHYHEFLYI